MAAKQDEIITKKYLNKRLKITTDYLDERLKLMGGYINERFDEFSEKMKERFDENKRDLLSIKDEIIAELKPNRDNQEMHDVSHTRINKTLRDHDERIEHLEAPPARN